MIQAICSCKTIWKQSEENHSTAARCKRCGTPLSLALGESLPSGAGEGDFDACLTITAGPDRVGEIIYLGGVADIALGKLNSAHIRLAAGQMVSRQHALLQRIDFGPSCWKVQDNRSTNGLFVNDQRILSAQLSDGDVVRIGEYELTYGHAIAPQLSIAPVAASVSAAHSSHTAVTGGTTCPSCERSLAHNARICTSCGIKVDTGRPILTSEDVDESYIHESARTWITLVSWLVWVTPLPMPLKSEAFGTSKPWAIRAIAALTIIASFIFLLGSLGSSDDQHFPGRALMLWPRGSHGANSEFDNPLKLTREEVRQTIKEMDDEEAAEFQTIRKRLKAKGVPEKELDREAIKLMFAEAIAEINRRLPRPEEFAWYQLFTHALLHDNSSILGFAFHLGGNLLFLFVFGSRVNALLGNLATAILYPALAAGSALIEMWVAPPTMPSLGASGAIMGLAGMYLILFPVHRVICGMWIRFRWWVAIKIFSIRGFWVLLIYFAYDVVTGIILKQPGDNVAHWAHMGGFLLGMGIALAILFSRQMNCGGADLLSVVLGKRAWGLIGRPARWVNATAA